MIGEAEEAPEVLETLGDGKLAEGSRLLRVGTDTLVADDEPGEGEAVADLELLEGDDDAVLAAPLQDDSYQRKEVRIVDGIGEDVVHDLATRLDARDGKV